MLSLEESKDRYQGIFIAAPVPMKDDYSLDLPKIGKCVDGLIDAGMRSGNAVYVVCGAGANVTNGYIRWRTSALAYCYAVVVDNLSNDGTFVPGAEYAQ